MLVHVANIAPSVGVDLWKLPAGCFEQSTNVKLVFNPAALPAQLNAAPGANESQLIMSPGLPSLESQK